MKPVSGRRAVVLNSLALAAATASAPVVAAPSRAAAATRYQVVFQVSDADPAKWSLTLANVRNAQVELGSDKVRIEIVAFGPGIGMLQAGSVVAARVADAIRSGAVVSACENTARAHGLSAAHMIGGVGFVPSGVAHLIRRQAEGYAYLRS